MTRGFIPPRGGYENLHSHKKSLIVFLATDELAQKWVRLGLGLGSRARDPMEPSARSGKQNIVKGSLASAPSKQTEIHLTHVARASIGDLREDFKAFPRLRGLRIGDTNDPRMLKFRALGTEQATLETRKTSIERKDPEGVGNVMVCLCAQTGYLLDPQIRELEQAFLREGGIRERMTRARLETRGDPQPAAAPPCPQCGKPMRRRAARKAPTSATPSGAVPATPTAAARARWKKGMGRRSP